MSDVKKEKKKKSSSKIKDKKEKKSKTKKEKKDDSGIKHTRESKEKIETGDKHEKKEKATKLKSSKKAEPEEPEDPSPKVEWEFAGSWERETAGGSVDHPSWRQNPQLFLTVPNETKITVTLSQKSAKNNIGFYILDSDGTGRKVVGNPTKLIMAESKFSKVKEVSKTYSLEPTKHPYVIIPCTAEPGQTGSFTIKVASQTESKPIIVEMRNKKRAWHETSFLGEWKGPSAGGNKDKSTFTSNPQYEINVRSSDTTLRILLLQNQIEKFDSLGLYLARLEASEGANSSKLVSPPKNATEKTPFSSGKEVLLATKVDAGRYVVIPCTFDAGQESKFDLKIYSDKPDVHAVEMGEQKGTILPGVWKDETAGGCMNHGSWRKNPQFFLHVKQKTPFSLQLTQQGSNHVIGFYIFKSDKNGNRRVLVKRAKHLVAKSDFVEAGNVTKEFTLEASKTPYVILPCTFDKGLEAPFTLTLYPLGSPDDVTLTPAQDNLFELTVNGKWKGENSGGCKNYYTWPSNPQYLLETPTKCQVTLFLQQPEKKTNKYKKSIGFYVHKVTPNKLGGYDFIWDDTNQPIAKGKFCKQKLVTGKFEAEAGAKYIVLVSLFHSGQASNYTLNLFASLTAPAAAPITLVPNPGTPYLSAQGAWTEESAGGCINNASWVHNPHFSLSVKRKCRVLLVLVQSPELSAKKKKEWDAIGLYINKGNEWGFPQIRKESDLIAKSDFEKFRDACISVTIEPVAHPYVVTPATFETGIVGNFNVLLFAAAEDLKDNLSLHYLDYGAIIKAIESGASPRTVAAVAEKPHQEKEKQKEPEKGVAPVAVVPQQPAVPQVNKEEAEKQALALKQQNEVLASKENEIVVKAGLLQKKENEIKGREDELASRLAELEKKEKEFRDKEEAWEKHRVERKERWRQKKKELEATRELKKEELEKQKEEKAKRAKEKQERKEREQKEKEERDQKEKEERERLAKEAAEAAAKNASKFPDKVKCPSCETTFDPLNPVLEAATISLAPILAPPPPPVAPAPAPTAPAPPPPISLVAPPPAPGPAVIAHEELKIARGSDGTDFLELLKRGIKLQDSKERKLADVPVKKEGDDWVVPFNVEKIVARRNALEMSDDEDAEEWDEWD